MGDNSALAGVPSPTSVEPLKLVAVDKKGHSWVNDIKELQSNEPFDIHLKENYPQRFRKLISIPLNMIAIQKEKY